jgi:hypothetical protein
VELITCVIIAKLNQPKRVFAYFYQVIFVFYYLLPLHGNAFAFEFLSLFALNHHKPESFIHKLRTYCITDHYTVIDFRGGRGRGGRRRKGRDPKGFGWKHSSKAVSEAERRMIMQSFEGFFIQLIPSCLLPSFLLVSRSSEAHCL